MKLIYYLLLLVTFSFYGQTEKGKIMFGASSNVSLIFNDSETRFNIKPEFSYFVANNLALGISVEYERVSTTTYTFNFNNVSEVDASYARNIMTPQITYFFDVNEKIKPFLKAKAGLLFEGNSVGNTANNNYGFTFGGVAGVSFFLNQNISIDFGIGYNQLDLGDNRPIVNQLSSNLGFSIFL